MVRFRQGGVGDVGGDRGWGHGVGNGTHALRQAKTRFQAQAAGWLCRGGEQGSAAGGACICRPESAHFVLDPRGRGPRFRSAVAAKRGSPMPRPPLLALPKNKRRRRNQSCCHPSSPSPLVESVGYSVVFGSLPRLATYAFIQGPQGGLGVRGKRPAPPPPAIGNRGEEK